MSIDDSTTASTTELCRLLDCTKGHLSHLERDGIVTRADRNAWPLVKTVHAVVAHMREQRQAASELRAKFEEARAARERQRLDREAHRLIAVDELYTAISLIAGEAVAIFESLPGSIWKARTDGELRAELKQWVVDGRTRLADRLNEQATSLRETGEAA